MEISLHSNQKHLALSYYLAIIKDVIMSKKTPFKKLYYADLYCGDGECQIKMTHEKYEPPIIESVLKPAINGKFEVSCFLNDLDSQNISKMKINTQNYIKFIDSYYCQDANICYKNILLKIPNDEISIFFLDPYNHKHLKWQTIKEISEHTHTYFDKKEGCEKIRRPELIINCMTYTMTGSYMAKDYKTINENLGTDEWQKLILEYKEKGINAPVEKALLDTFINQLKSLGYKVPTPIKILNTSPPNTVYYLVWATNNKGYEIIENKVIPYMNKRIAKVHENNEKKLIQVKARRKGEADINKWI